MNVSACMEATVTCMPSRTNARICRQAVVGLTEALSSFTGMFAEGSELQSMHASGRRQLLVEAETDIWIGLVRREARS